MSQTTLAGWKKIPHTSHPNVLCSFGNSARFQKWCECYKLVHSISCSNYISASKYTWFWSWKINKMTPRWSRMTSLLTHMAATTSEASKSTLRTEFPCVQHANNMWYTASHITLYVASKHQHCEVCQLWYCMSKDLHPKDICKNSSGSQPGSWDLQIWPQSKSSKKSGTQTWSQCI